MHGAVPCGEENDPCHIMQLHTVVIVNETDFLDRSYDYRFSLRKFYSCCMHYKCE